MRFRRGAVSIEANKLTTLQTMSKNFKHTRRAMRALVCARAQHWYGKVIALQAAPAPAT
jgi:hypothetical protein